MNITAEEQIGLEVVLRLTATVADQVVGYYDHDYRMPLRLKESKFQLGFFFIKQYLFHSLAFNYSKWNFVFNKRKEICIFSRG